MNIFLKILWSIFLLFVTCFIGYLLLAQTALWLRIIGFIGVLVLAGWKGYDLWFKNTPPIK